MVLQDNDPLQDDRTNAPVTLAVFALPDNSAASQVRANEPVMLVLSVTDRYGCPLSGLAARDFQVTTSAGKPIAAHNFTEDATIKGTYRLQIIAPDSLDSLMVHLARANTDLRGRGIVNFNARARSL